MGIDSPPWSKASSPIWNMVCHYPGEKRRRRAIMVLHAYIDESEGGVAPGEPSSFVFGGYLASAEKWAAFSDEWQQTLDMRPVMKSLHFKEVHARRWEDPAFADRLCRFYRIIEDTVSMSFYCSINLDDLDKAARLFPVPILDLNPYRIGFARLIYQVAKHLPDFNLVGPVEFIFDKHSNENAIRAEWEKIRVKLGSVASSVSDQLAFRSDDEVLPLQAADMLAWWCRRKHLEKVYGAQRLDEPWTRTREIPGFQLDFPVSEINETLWSIPAYSGSATGKFSV